jgi:hypothetical protein
LRASVTPIECPTTSTFSAPVYCFTASMNARTSSRYFFEWCCSDAFSALPGPHVIAYSSDGL